MTKEIIRVLYADDEPALLEIAKIFLEKNGDFVVDTFTSALEALDQLEKERYDVIISDYQMPEMDGISFLRRIRSAGNETSFIIFTGRGREEVVIEALNEGADFYLQKGGEPVAQFAELEHKIRHAISRRAAVHALKKSERDYRHLIEHANEAIYIVQDQMLRMVNPKLAEMTGYSEQELAAYPMTRFIHPDDRPMVVERYERRIRGEEVPSRYIFRLLRKDGNACWVELSVVVISWDDRPAVLVFLTDISERKRAEDALREREERYGQFFRTTLDCVFITTPDGRWIDFNDALVEMFGYSSRDEMSAVPVPSIYANPEERGEFLTTVIREGYVKERPLRFRKRDGTVFDSLITIVPLKNPDGSVKAFIGTFRDITERKRAEEALRTSEERYRQFFKTTRDSVFITTPDGHWIDCNDALVETLGFTSRSEIMELPVSSVYANPEERRGFLTRVETEGYVKEHPLRFRKRDGTVFDALITIVPLKNPDGSVKAFIGTVRDITEQKRVGEALRESEERYRYIFETFEDLYYQTDMSGAITILSPSLFRLTGWREDELLGKPATILYSNPDERTALLDEIEKKGYVRDYEIRLVKRDGTETPVSVSANRIFDANGTPAGVAGILRDITRRKQAEEALKESEEKFRTVVEYCLEAILILDMEGKILFANNAAARTVECESGRSMTGRNVLEFIAPESLQDVNNDFREVAGGHDAYLAHYNVITDRGNRISIESIGKVVTYGGARADLVSIRDVTLQKQAEEALFSSQQMLQTVLDTIPQRVFWKDKKSVYLGCNRSCAADAGFSAPAEMIGKTDYDYTIQDIAERYRADDLKVMESGTPRLNYEETRVRPDSSRAWIRTNKVPLHDKEGTVIGVLGTYEDITEFKHSMEALRTSEEKYRQILETLQDAYIRTDRDGRITMVNPSAVRMFGYASESEMIGMPAGELHAGPDGRDAMLRRLEESGILTDVSGILKKKDGTLFWASLNIQFIRDEGSIAGTATILRDITERRSMEQAIQEANRKLSLLNSITRHDVTNQLIVLRGYARIAMMRDSDPVVIDFVQKIDAAAETIARQLEFTKTYQELGVHMPAWFRLTDTVAKTRRPEISIAGTCRQIEVFADPMLERVFFNLFDNAVRHGVHVSTVSIRCERAPDGLVIIVEDDGTGIPPEEKEKIFEKGVGKNTGYGLFLAREILAITGIAIRETGYVGVGARFEITVPDGTWRYAAETPV